MKRAFIFFGLLLIVFATAAQPKTRGKVKRKYRNVEQVNETLPEVIFRGLVRDIHKNPVPGASVEIMGLNRLVHSNEYGQFMLTGLPTGRLRLKVSCIGYRTKTLDYVLQEGFNDHYVALDRERVHLETLISSSQKREQHISDVPASIDVITDSFGKKLNITDFNRLAEYIPALGYETAGAGTAGFFMNGVNPVAGFTGISPSVALFYDEVPVTVHGMLSPLLFDMERAEVIKGPRNSLSGSNALGGAVHIISKKPDNYLNGYVTAGGGSFGAKELQAAVNVPVIKKLLYVRTAGIYSADNGYVENTFGGNLNGNSTWGGRFSLQLLPGDNHKLDMSMNYIREDRTGTALVNSWTAGTNFNVDSNGYRFSLNRGDELGSQQEAMDGSLSYRYFVNAHNYFTSVTSYRKNKASGIWDADGTGLAALEMEDKQNTDVFYQELRYNFSRKSRLNGSAGLSYSKEKSFRQHYISSNDQLIYDIINSSAGSFMPSESRFPLHPQPLNPAPMADAALSGQHIEENIHDRLWQSAQGYLHFTYRFNQVLFFNGGIRAFYDRMKLTHESVFSGGDASGLGQFSNSSPNLVYLPSEQQQISESFLSVAGEAGLTYRWNENFSLYGNVARGRKPQVLLFTWDSRPYVLDAEKIDNAEAGWKWIIKDRVYWEVNGFYRRHSNVHAVQWGSRTGEGLLSDNGKAVSYGAETGLKAAVVKGVEVFGNYAWLYSEFDSTSVGGSLYTYAGNQFSNAPQHSFTAGLSAKTAVTKGMHVFVSPRYSWKSQYFLTESNTSGLVQNAFGLLHINAGIEFDAPKAVLSVYGTNLLDEKYLHSGGHWGGVFGMPTGVLGAPRMLGAKVSWSF